MFDGDFEIHLTVLADLRLAGFAAAQGLKYTHIVLDRGATPDQPMLTLRVRGPFADVAAEAHDWQARLGRDGFTVVRVKVEASPLNVGVPQLDALLADLAAAGLTIVEVEQEYVVLDSNPAVDAGWIAA